jgi:hypothetical protein
MDKFFKSLKKIHQNSYLNKHILLRSRKPILDKALVFKSNKLFTLGNFEFTIFFTSIGFVLYHIHLNKDKYSETARLISTGLITNALVDFITYIGDKINTQSKVESFHIKKTDSAKDINTIFDKEVLHKTNRQVKPIHHKTPSYYTNLLNLKGIQAAIGSTLVGGMVFYGLYKNIKYWIKENLHIDGFFNFFVSAGIAQFISMIFYFPLENIKKRMQASSFNYDSFYIYYKKLLKGHPIRVKINNIKTEYSGFSSNLLLYVVFESVTFSIYESIMKLNYFKQFQKSDEVNFYAVILASLTSGLIAAIVTNPIDVYQINKQINPKFSTSQMNKWNIFTGMKERIILVTFGNLLSFVCLEYIGHKYFDVRIE